MNAVKGRDLDVGAASHNKQERLDVARRCTRSREKHIVSASSPMLARRFSKAATPATRDRYLTRATGVGSLVKFQRSTLGPLELQLVGERESCWLTTGQLVGLVFAVGRVAPFAPDRRASLLRRRRRGVGRGYLAWTLRVITAPDRRGFAPCGSGRVHSRDRCGLSWPCDPDMPRIMKTIMSGHASTIAKGSSDVNGAPTAISTATTAARYVIIRLP